MTGFIPRVCRPLFGYNPGQLRALETTINDADADVVVTGTPADLGRLLRINKPIVRARYEFVETGDTTLSTIIDKFLDRYWQHGDP